MKKKTVRNFVYDGLGFPVWLSSVEMIFIEDDWHPQIDVQKLAKKAMIALVSQPGRLTGSQVKFIRSYFSMTLREFAKRVVHESHTAVSKWEKSVDDATSMDGNIEAMLRLYIYEQVAMKTEKQQHDFYKKYQQVKQLFLSSKSPIMLQLIA